MASARVRSRPKLTIPERPSRRAKAAVSYAESADEGDDGSYPDIYRDSDKEDPPKENDAFVSEGKYSAPATRPKRSLPQRPLSKSPAKRRRAVTTKAERPERREFSSDVDASDSNTDSEDDTPIMRRVMQQRPGQTRSSKSSRRSAPRTPSNAVVRSRQPSIDGHSEGQIPAWGTLPYHVLLNIMSILATPLIDERNFNPTQNFRSVLNAAMMCRSWSEPALTVLWQDPVLVPMERAHLLSRQLQADPTSTSYNYRQKLQHISLEVHQTATYSLPGSGVFNIANLAWHCPRLQTLELYHFKDLAPYRDLDESIKWSYPPELWGALAQNISGKATELKSWRWSSRLVSKAPITGGYDFTLLNRVHLTPSFQSLKKLAFINYQTPDVPRKLPAGYVHPETEKNLTDTIALLPNLKHLIFEACGIVNGTLLPLLPENLEHLEIIACGELLSDELAAFLLTHGSHLKSLVLDHNQALSLSWLTILKAACPRLEMLQCNLAYYNLHGTYKDNEPTFKELLSVNEIPTWPSTLRSLELTQLRKWEAKAAENLFSSLLDSASELPDLRVLIVKAILDSISWRDRGGFRDRWMKRFDHVFKRVSAPPREELRSLGAHKLWREEKEWVEARKGEIIIVESSDEDDQPIPLIRKEAGGGLLTYKVDKQEVKRRKEHTKIKEKERKRSRELEWLRESEKAHGVGMSYATNGPERPQDDEPIAVRRRRSRIEDQKMKSNGMQVLVDGRSITTPGGTRYGRDDSHDVDTTYHSEGSISKDQFIQGMCDIVELRIDNLRPTENQFTEADFLDSEPEEDGDWDGEGGDGNGWVW